MLRVMDPLHATIEEFAAEGYTHVECYCPRLSRQAVVVWGLSLGCARPRPLPCKSSNEPGPQTLIPAMLRRCGGAIERGTAMLLSLMSTRARHGFFAAAPSGS